MPNTPVPAAAIGLPETMPRRGFLRGTFPALAAVAAAAALPSLAWAACPDAELLAKGPDLEALLAEWNAALHDYSVAQRTYFDERPLDPVFDIERHISMPPEEGLAHQRQWSVRVAAHKAEIAGLRLKYDVDELDRRANRIGDEAMNRLAEVSEHRATTIEGLKFKARMAKHDEDVAASMIEDILALNA